MPSLNAFWVRLPVSALLLCSQMPHCNVAHTLLISKRVPALQYSCQYKLGTLQYCHFSCRRERVVLEGRDEALHGHGAAPTDATPTPKHNRRVERRSIDNLLACAALEGASADVARRPGSNARSSEDSETDSERRARRKARKEMRRLAAAAALAEAPHTHDSAAFEGFPGAVSPTTSHSQGIPVPFLHLHLPPTALAPTPKTPSRTSKQRKTRRSPIWTGWRTRALQARTKADGRVAFSISLKWEIIEFGERGDAPKPKKSKKKTKHEITLQRDVVDACLPIPFPYFLPCSLLCAFPPGRGWHQDSAIDVDFGPPLSGSGGEDDFDGTPGGFGASDFYGDAHADAAGGEQGLMEEREWRCGGRRSRARGCRGAGVLGLGRGWMGFRAGLPQTQPTAVVREPGEGQGRCGTLLG
ncbi:hypothetical protein C8R45DRAFT_1124925 [Mycena sanguinolenta]|nr:hypothetical protein C8R45DRAFT_1124925 [Mycena sanguinolenta]